MRARLPVSVLFFALICAGAQGDLRFFLDEGLDFTGSTFGVQSGWIPPDTMGAVGRDHIVELINGTYRVYDKNTGSALAQSSLNVFWSNAGASRINNAFDPRVVYDPFSERWFASSVDNGAAANNILLAVSNSDNPLDGWTGFAIDSDSDDSHWADFETLGFNLDGVFVAANMFDLRDGSNETRAAILAVPKSDLIGATPTVANATLFQDIALSGTGFAIQPIVDLDNSGMPQGLLAAYNTGSGVLKYSSLTGSVSSPTLSTGGGFIAVDPYAEPPSAEQPGPKQDIDVADSRLSSNVVRVGGSLWGVQTVESGGRAALRWFEIDEATGTAVQEGLISDTELDFYYGSIAVSHDGFVAVGFSGSSENEFVGSYVAFGETQGGTTLFRDPQLLHAGVASYERTDSKGRNRWGDYSATVLDPYNPRTFWTFQEFASAEDIWSTRITRLDITRTPEPTTLALMVLGLGGVWLQRRRGKT